MGDDQNQPNSQNPTPQNIPSPSFSDQPVSQPIPHSSQTTEPANQPEPLPQSPQAVTTPNSVNQTPLDQTPTPHEGSQNQVSPQFPVQPGVTGSTTVTPPTQSHVELQGMVSQTPQLSHVPPVATTPQNPPTQTSTPMPQSPEPNTQFQQASHVSQPVQPSSPQTPVSQPESNTQNSPVPTQAPPGSTVVKPGEVMPMGATSTSGGDITSK